MVVAVVVLNGLPQQCLPCLQTLTRDPGVGVTWTKPCTEGGSDSLRPAERRMQYRMMLGGLFDRQLAKWSIVGNL